MQAETRTVPKGIYLEAGEELKLITRQHWYVFRDPFLLCFFVPFVLLSAVFFIDHFLGQTWYSKGINQFLLVAAFISLVLGSLLFLWRLFLWLRTYYLVTSKRLILVIQKGLFSRERRETSLDMIQDVKARVDGIQPALYGYGDVISQVSSQEARLTFERVGKPYHVQRVIMREAKLRNIEAEEEKKESDNEGLDN